MKKYQKSHLLLAAAVLTTATTQINAEELENQSTTAPVLTVSPTDTVGRNVPVTTASTEDSYLSSNFEEKGTAVEVELITDQQVSQAIATASATQSEVDSQQSIVNVAFTAHSNAHASEVVASQAVEEASFVAVSATSEAVSLAASAVAATSTAYASASASVSAIVSENISELAQFSSQENVVTERSMALSVAQSQQVSLSTAYANASASANAVQSELNSALSASTQLEVSTASIAESQSTLSIESTSLSSTKIKIEDELKVAEQKLAAQSTQTFNYDLDVNFKVNQTYIDALRVREYWIDKQTRGDEHYATTYLENLQSLVKKLDANHLSNEDLLFAQKLGFSFKDVNGNYRQPTQEEKNAVKRLVNSDVFLNQNSGLKQNHDTLKSAARTGLRENTYTPSEKDKQTTLDVLALSDDQFYEINLFAVKIVNQIRQAFGSEQVIPTKGMLEFAKKLNRAVSAEESKKADNFSGTTNLDYDRELLDRLSKEFGLFGGDVFSSTPNSIYKGQYPADLVLSYDLGLVSDDRINYSNHLIPNRTMTMADLKSYVYNGFKSMLFEAEFDNSRTMVDSTSTEPNNRAWDHALGLAGIRRYRREWLLDPMMSSTIVMKRVGYGPTPREYTIGLYIFQNSRSTADENLKKVNAPIGIIDASKYYQEGTGGNKENDLIRINSSIAQTDLDRARDDIAAAKSKLEQIAKEEALLKGKQDALAKEVHAVAQAKQKLNLAVLQNKVEASNQSLKALEVALADSENKVKALEQEYVIAVVELSRIKSNINNKGIVFDLSAYEKAYNDAKEGLEKLIQAIEIYEQAVRLFANALDLTTQTKQVYEVELDKLNSLKLLNDEAQLSKHMIVDAYKKQVVVTISEIVMPFKTIREEEPILELGQEVVVTEGVEGLKVVTYENGVAVNEEIVRLAIDQVIKVGTKEQDNATQDSTPSVDDQEVTVDDKAPSINAGGGAPSQGLALIPLETVKSSSGKSASSVATVSQAAVKPVTYKIAPSQFSNGSSAQYVAPTTSQTKATSATMSAKKQLPATGDVTYPAASLLSLLSMALGGMIGLRKKK